MTDGGAPSRPWRGALVGLCLAVIAVNVGLVIATAERSGWDFTVYCGAVRAADAGRNPYVLEELGEFTGRGHPFVYPAVSLAMFRPLCGERPTTAYRVAWLALLAVTFFILQSAVVGGDDLFLATLLATCLMSAFWNLHTGNVGLVQLLPFAVACHGVARGRYGLAAVFIGLTAALKMVPIVLAGLFLFCDRPHRRRLVLIAVAVATMIVVVLPSWLLYPDIASSYYRSLADNPVSPLREGGGSFNQASAFLIRHVVEVVVGDGRAPWLAVYGLFAVGATVAFVAFARSARGGFVEVFSLGVLVFFVVFPRLKPYSTTLAVPAVYFLMGTRSVPARLVTVLTLCVGPLALTRLPSVVQAAPTVAAYGQLLCLLTFVGLYVGQATRLRVAASRSPSP